MTNKNILIGLVLTTIVLLGGYFFYNSTSQEVVPKNTNQTAQQGKINIDAVCEESLMYKTFPDGASAELFVKECKEGKHPEVIEEYKTRMGFGDGAQI